MFIVDAMVLLFLLFFFQLFIQLFMKKNSDI